MTQTFRSSLIVAVYVVVGLLGTVLAVRADAAPGHPCRHHCPTTTTTTQPTTTTAKPTSTTSTTSTTTTTTMPAGMGFTPDQCQLSQLAFCDTFQTLNPGGRGGDLNEANWSFSRVQQQTNPSEGLVNNYAGVNAEFCMDHKIRIADNDSFICGEQYNESNHWMEAMDDQGEYASQGARILQPFDFAGRTGSVVFSVDAKTEGNHSAWPEVWLTADPDQQPHDDFPGTHIFPKEGVMLNFGADWCGNGGNGGTEATNPHNPIAGNIRLINEYHNYVETSHDERNQAPCYTTHDDMANHFKITVSQTLIQVWASNDDGSNFILRASQPVSLPFTRGYLSFEHAEYNADKFDNMNPTTYHWHAIGFDGPVLPVDRDYQVPDALVSLPNNSRNLGYQTNTPTFSLPGVNPTGESKGYVTLNVYWYSSPLALSVNLNGHLYNAADPDPNTGAHRYQWHYILLPVNLADVAAGTNTLSIANTGCSDQCPTVANIDLELVHG